jgi:hypothetical protein
VTGSLPLHGWLAWKRRAPKENTYEPALDDFRSGPARSLEAPDEALPCDKVGYRAAGEQNEDDRAGDVEEREGIVFGFGLLGEGWLTGRHCGLLSLADFGHLEDLPKD